MPDLLAFAVILCATANVAGAFGNRALRLRIELLEQQLRDHARIHHGEEL